MFIEHISLAYKGEDPGLHFSLWKLHLLCTWVARSFMYMIFWHRKFHFDDFMSQEILF
jgi:hypothetical protein